MDNKLNSDILKHICLNNLFSDTCDHVKYVKYVNSRCLPGSDIHILRSDGTADHDNCQEWCDNNSTCAGFTFHHNLCYFRTEACRNDITYRADVVLYLKIGS